MGFRGNCCRHDDWNRNFSEAGRDGARRSIRFRRVCGVDCGRSAVAVWCAGIRGIGRDDSGSRRRIRIFAPRIRSAVGIFVWLDALDRRPAVVFVVDWRRACAILGISVPAIGAPIFTLHIAVPGLTHWIAPYDFVFTWAQPLAVFWIVGMTGVNYLGVRLGGAVQVFPDGDQDHVSGDCDWRRVFRPARCGGYGARSDLAERADRRRLQRIPSSACGSTLGLRRLGRSKSRRLRSRKSITKFSPCARGRSRSRGADLFSLQRSMPKGAAVRSCRNLAAHRIRCRRARSRPRRGGVDHDRDGDFGARLDELFGAERRSAHLRDGARRIIFQSR